MGQRDDTFMKLLVVEDKKTLADALEHVLSAVYQVDVVFEGQRALRLAAVNHYDVIILDVGLPDISGLEVCRLLRQQHIDASILIMTGTYRSTQDKIVGLDYGADDYILKPVDSDELLARIRALLRRKSDFVYANILTHNSITLDLNKRTVHCRGSIVPLRRREFDVLEYLLRNKERVVTRDMIRDHVWASDSESFSNTIEAHIKGLRAKIDKQFNQKLIHTVYGLGYKIG